MRSRIKVLKNGPLQLVSEQQILFIEGAPVTTADPASLCTCGKSGKKPFCDGTHGAAGFTSEREIDAEILQEYPGKEITVYFNRSICSGAAECVRGLPTVFKSGDGSNWIFPDNDTVEDVVARVNGCVVSPSP